MKFFYKVIRIVCVDFAVRHCYTVDSSNDFKKIVVNFNIEAASDQNNKLVLSCHRLKTSQ